MIILPAEIKITREPCTWPESNSQELNQASLVLELEVKKQNAEEQTPQTSGSNEPGTIGV